MGSFVISRTGLLANHVGISVTGSNGNVGIGTTSPGAKLQVGDGTTDVATRVYYSDNTYAEVRGYGMQFSRTTSYLRPTTDDTKTLNIGQSSLQWNILSMDASTTTFNTNGSENMRITSTGKVGIGVNNPTANLEVGTTSTTSDSIIRVLSGNGYVAGFEAYGSTQGTGYLYVGQGSTTGGGIRYNGDDSPDVVGATDHTTFFRRNGGAEDAVFSYPHSSNTVSFYGPIETPSASIDFLTVDKDLRHTNGHAEANTATYTVKAGDRWIRGTRNNDISVTLPPVLASKGRQLTFICQYNYTHFKLASGNILRAASGTSTTNITPNSSYAQGDVITIYSDGTNWRESHHND